MIGRVFRVSFPADSDDRIALFTYEGRKQGTMIEFLRQVSNATGFGMYEEPLSKDALDKYDYDTYLACEYDLTLGNTDICVGTFYGSEDNEYTTGKIYEEKYYLAVEKAEETLLYKLLLPVMPLTFRAWLAIFCVSFYALFVLSILRGGRRLSSKTFCSKIFTVLFRCIMSFTGGQIAIDQKKVGISEKVIYAAFAIFGLIVLT